MVDTLRPVHAETAHAQTAHAGSWEGDRGVPAGTPVYGQDGAIGSTAAIRPASENNPNGYLLVRTARFLGLAHRTRLVPLEWVHDFPANHRAIDSPARVTLDATRAQVAGCPVLRDDREIQADVEETLSQTGGFFRAPEIRSSVREGVVRLTGHASSIRIKQAAVSRALAVAGVVDVDDHSYEDGSLIIAVAQALLSEPETRSAHLSVTSRIGVIGLNGAVPSEEARERATALANAVPGVAGVVNSVEVRRRTNVATTPHATGHDGGGQ